MKHSQRTANCPLPRRARTQVLSTVCLYLSFVSPARRPSAPHSTHLAVSYFFALSFSSRCWNRISPTRTFSTSRLLQFRMQLLILTAVKFFRNERERERFGFIYFLFFFLKLSEPWESCDCDDRRETAQKRWREKLIAHRTTKLHIHESTFAAERYDKFSTPSWRYF